MDGRRRPRHVHPRVAFFGVGLIAFGITMLIGWAAGASMVMDTIVGTVGFLGVLGLPFLGALIALVSLVGAIARPGTRPARTRLEPVGRIDWRTRRFDEKRGQLDTSRSMVGSLSASISLRSRGLPLRCRTPGLR